MKKNASMFKNKPSSSMGMSMSMGLRLCRDWKYMENASDALTESELPIDSGLIRDVGNGAKVASGSVQQSFSFGSSGTDSGGGVIPSCFLE